MIGILLFGRADTSHAQTGQDALWIALVGPLSGDSTAIGQEMAQSVQLALDQVNSNGGVNGRHVRLRTYDDENDPDLARQRAQEIVDANEALVVIGHNTSDTSAAAGEIYAQNGIPAISGSATADAVTADNDWYFRTVFDNSTQANYVAHYLYHILGRETASVIYTDSQYGRTLADSFEANFAELGGTVAGTWSIDPASADAEGDVNEILDALEALAESTDRAPGTLFLAMSAEDARDFVLAMRARDVQYPLFGSDAIGSLAFARQFADYPAGTITQNIYAAVPLIYDSANAQAQALHDQYVATYGADPSWRTATFYDAAMVTVEAMRRAELTGELSNNAADRADDRETLRQVLAAINTVEGAYPGASGAIYFDDAGNSQIPVAVGIFQNRTLISASVQLRAVVDPERDGLQAEIEAGDVFRIDGQLVDQAQIVYTGMEFVRVGDIDQVESTYSVDFYLWFRAPETVNATDIEFVNAVGTINIGRPIQEARQGNLLYQVFRVNGTFKGQFQFYDYPFDSQLLTLNFRHAELTRDQLIYAVDVIGMTGPEAGSTLARQQAAGVYDTVTNWDPVAVRFSQEVTASDSGLGNPNYLVSGNNIEFSRFHAEIQIERKVLNFITKNLLPVLLIVVAMYLALFIAPDQINPRMTIGVNGLLTNAFFLVTLSNNLPEIGYTVAIEYVFYFVFLLAITVIVLSLLVYNAQKEKEAIRTRRLTWIGRIAYPLMILIFAIFFGIHYNLIAMPWS